MKKNARSIKSKVIFGLLSTVVSVVVFLKLFQEISVNQIILLFQELSLVGVLSFVTLSFAGSLMRAWRYQVLLAQSGYVVSSVPLFFVTLIRNLAADLLPARIGTLVYIYLIRDRLGVPYTSGVTSFSIAFFFDLFSLIPFLFVLLLFQVPGVRPASLLLILTCVCIATLIFFMALPGVLKFCKSHAARFPALSDTLTQF
ncbi:MAG: flippase-like domain-containing protein, partial [Bdellovibrionales bacterium]|nr:flippase-like domain-containing protein [Bdellovibrionales bacterium]